MKKLSYILLAACLLLSFTACGEKKGDSTSKESTKTSAGSEAEVKGEEYDTGNFKVTVPSGWKVFPKKDMLSDNKETVDPNGLHIIKGGVTEMDFLTKPSIEITYSADSTLSVVKEFYKDVEDMEDLVIGDHTWTAFRAKGLDCKMIILYEGKEKIKYKVDVMYETGNEKIDLNDEDVQAILSSIQTTNPNDSN